MNTNEVLNKLKAEIERLIDIAEKRINNNASIEHPETVDEENLKYLQKTRESKITWLDGQEEALKKVLSIITSLQQEQPEVDLDSQVFANVDGKETIVETGGIKGNLEEIPSNVDLEKEIEGTTGDYAEGRRLEQRILEESRRFPEVSFAKLSRIAKHFYDFGKQAGAKWMAEQGVTIKGEILTYIGSKTLWFENDSLKDLQDFENGEKVIIQIRKNESTSEDKN